MAQFRVYLRFNGRCKEAMEFYKQIFGGELTLQTIGQSPMAAQMPAMRDKIMHSLLSSGNIQIMGSDMNPDEGYKHGNSIVLSLIGESKGEIETLFAKLAQGGKVTHPINEEFFGTYGDLMDKFGVNWLFEYGTNQNQ